MMFLWVYVFCCFFFFATLKVVRKSDLEEVLSETIAQLYCSDP